MRSDASILHCGERGYESAADPYVAGTTEDYVNAETQRERQGTFTTWRVQDSGCDRGPF